MVSFVHEKYREKNVDYDTIIVYILIFLARTPSKPVSWNNERKILISLSQKSSVSKAVTLSARDDSRAFALTLFVNTFHFFIKKNAFVITDNTYTKRPKTTCNYKTFKSSFPL